MPRPDAVTLSRRPLRTAWFAALAIAFAVWVGGCSPPESALEADPASDWRRWRGPNGQGVSEAVGLPTVWTEAGEKFRWKTRTPGAGNSSPVVSQGRAFLTTVYGKPGDDWAQAWLREELHRVVVALDMTSGEILWQTSVLHGGRGKVHHSNTRAAPTPVTDGKQVFASFDGILAALDLDGEVAWTTEVDPDYYVHAHYGTSTSPILAGDAVILSQDREKGDAADSGWIAAFDKETGTELWRDEWDHTCCSYTTPIVLERGGRTELVRSSTNEVVAYDPTTGERLWQTEHQNTQPVPSLLTRDDLLCMPGAVHDRTIKVVRLSGAGDQTVVEPLWASGNGVPKIPTPIFYRDRLYALTDNAVIMASDPQTGEELFKGRAAPGQYRASLIAGDGKIYAVNQYGNVTVVDAEKDKFRRLANNSLGEPTRGATPAIAEGCLLFRTENHLICVEETGEPAADGDVQVSKRTPPRTAASG